MKVAWEEIKHGAKKFFLIEMLLVLLMFMVLFLSGLTNGLGRAVSAGIEQIPASYFVLSSDAEKVASFSHLDGKVTDQLKDGKDLLIQRSGLEIDGEKKDVTYFVLEGDNFILPKLAEGESFSKEKEGLVLDLSFKDKGVQLGDEVEDTASHQKLRVTGFVKDGYYGHSPLAYISKETFVAMKKVTNPNYEWSPQVLVSQEKPDLSGLVDVEVVDKQNLIQHIPGYQAEQMTLTMIIWVLLLTSAAVLGVFFYILTLQKYRQFGVLKAIGMSMREIAVIQLSQIALLAAMGAVLGTALTYGLAQVLPASMPFYLQTTSSLTVLASFLVIALICGLISVFKVSKIDPIEVIGGSEV